MHTKTSLIFAAIITTLPNSPGFSKPDKQEEPRKHCSGKVAVKEEKDALLFKYILLIKIESYRWLYIC
jgi:hypothetical protein